MTEEKKTMVEIIKGAVIPCGPKSLAEPEKELRFTRAAQAPLFFGLSVVFLIMTLAVFILSTQDWGMGGPILDGWLWLCLLGLLLCYWMIRLGVRCTRNAYII
ncbi:MAG TPA: hypothetical protein DHW77_07700, partial [Verrucomicrobiales bacterium]|nr:hypothetical protein [Verrucomicrobiales bacterium]